MEWERRTASAPERLGTTKTGRRAGTEGLYVGLGRRRRPYYGETGVQRSASEAG